MAWENVTVAQCQAGYPQKSLASVLRWGSIAASVWELYRADFDLRRWLASTTPLAMMGLGMTLGSFLLGYDESVFYTQCNSAYQGAIATAQAEVK